MTPQIFLFGGGESLREQGTGNREQGKCRVPQVFPEHVPEPLRENPSLESRDFLLGPGGMHVEYHAALDRTTED